MLSGLLDVCGGIALSVACTVKLMVPKLFAVVSGMPVIAPVFALIIRPCGSAPLVIENVTGAIPPLVATASL